MEFTELTAHSHKIYPIADPPIKRMKFGFSKKIFSFGRYRKAKITYPLREGIIVTLGRHVNPAG